MLLNRKIPTVDGKIYRVARKLAYLHFDRRKWSGACSKEEQTQWLVDNYWDGWIKDAKIIIEEFNKI